MSIHIYPYLSISIIALVGLFSHSQLFSSQVRAQKLDPKNRTLFFLTHDPMCVLFLSLSSLSCVAYLSISIHMYHRSRGSLLVGLILNSQVRTQKLGGEIECMAVFPVGFPFCML